MNRTFLLALLVLALAGSFLSCAQAPVEYVHRVDTLYIRDTVHVPDPIDTNALKLKGTLHGKAGLHSYLSLTDYSGITVSLTGTPFSATTDSAGIWAIHDLPTGMYNITYSKEGFHQFKVFGYQFVGGGDVYLTLPNVASPIGQPATSALYPALIAMLPAGIRITDLEFSRRDSIRSNLMFYYFDGELSPNTSGMHILLLFGRDSAVGFDNSVWQWDAAWRGNPSTGRLESPTSVTGKYEQAALSNQPLWSRFPLNETLFVAAYPVLPPPPTYPAVVSYWDPLANRYITPGDVPIRSNVTGFILH